MFGQTVPYRLPFVWILGLALVAGCLALSSLWSPLLLAAWCAHLVRPMHKRLSSHVGGRSRSAGVLTVIFALTLMVPLLVLGLSLVGSAAQLMEQMRQSQDWTDAMNRFLSGTRSSALVEGDPRSIVAVIQRHGVGALGAASTLFGAATTFALFMLVFIACFYWFLVESRHIETWAHRYLPVHPRYQRQIAAAFFETGRGLLISFGLTALLQATILAVGYAVIGVPQPLVLGLVTLFASFVPLLGTGLVWVPVTAGLFLVGHNDAALWSLGVGCVVSLLDNLLRPALSRYGKLQLPTTVVLVAMLGGMASFGPGGILLGPLFVRLAAEALAIWRHERKAREPIPAPVLPPPRTHVTAKRAPVATWRTAPPKPVTVMTPKPAT